MASQQDKCNQDQDEYLDLAKDLKCFNFIPAIEASCVGAPTHILLYPWEILLCTLSGQ